MGVYLPSVVFVLSLIALSLGLNQLMQVKKDSNTCIKFHKFLTHVVIVFAIIMVVISGVETFKRLIRGPNFCYKAQKQMVMGKHHRQTPPKRSSS